ncbi:TIGR03620 family F420-dependent LLM class oxidoreductase [Streptomyces roseoverticillatus]|uniref:TIGR03620 family F420-dependent LLM class oxidoreductase n=1 Tax=Streptomyces roseoverticillatus TaxID=66429 RepID=UPI001F3C6B45|nr:TIGR03620 family F420-dependent LLM class oxidoreductase [Streptomyces roseoverticillatus]MCF3104913.1 TIGR03620 family F420-dependent LLM class oxidoreductase [Streptomyces roseoverticillatus]
MNLDPGLVGIWSLAFTHGDRGAACEAAAELEELGYGTLWLGGNPGGNPRGDLVTTAGLLAATSRTVVAPACVSVWHQSAPALASTYQALPARMRNRLLLGLGVGHPKTDQDYHRPYTSLCAYLDELDGLDGSLAPIPRAARILGAHGPRMTWLAATRAAGVHPHLTTAGHTVRTRELLGDGPLLAPSVSVVLETSPSTARATARAALAPYLAQPNYANNWLSSGFTADDLADHGSDHLIDALFAWGTLDRVTDRITEHLQAGADHVAVQVVTDATYGFPLTEWRTLAQPLKQPSSPGRV